MTKEKLNYESQMLAKVVICSFKSNKEKDSWLNLNETYRPKGDRVISQALDLIRSTLKDESFDLKKYKSENKSIKVKG